MLEYSDKPLVLFLMNGRQLGLNDEKVFLDNICSNMKKGESNKNSFAVNQLDAFKPNPNNDGEECIVKALTSVRNFLNERGIKNANIFPFSQVLLLRKELTMKTKSFCIHYIKGKEYETMRFNEYYYISHLLLSIREKLQKK